MSVILLGGAGISGGGDGGMVGRYVASCETTGVGWSLEPHDGGEGEGGGKFCMGRRVNSIST